MEGKNGKGKAEFYIMCTDGKFKVIKWNSCYERCVAPTLGGVCLLALSDKSILIGGV